MFGVKGYISPYIPGISGTTVTQADKERIIRAYDAEIRGTDTAFADLYSAIEEHSGTNKAAIVVCADHGESFWEHKNFTSHGNDLYDEELRVPLIIRPPENIPFRQGLKVSGQVALIDIAPTLLSFAGATNPVSWHGKSLISAIQSGNAGATPVVIDTSIMGRHRRGVRNDQWKVIADPPFEKPGELYDLVNDPGETNNLILRSAEIPGEVTPLIKLLKPEVSVKTDAGITP